MQIIINLLFAVVFCVGVDAYSRGAPDAACTNLTPRHGPAAQGSPPPFNVNPLQNSTQSGNLLTVRLSSLPGNSFKGFLLQAHDVSNNKPVGKFVAGTGSKTMSCSLGTSNSVTHSSSSAKDLLDVTWQAPTDFSGEVTFRSTFVKDYATFWTSVASAKVRVERAASSPGATVLTVYDGCGQTKNCFGLPVNCQLSGNCDALVTYIRNSSTSEFEFELFGKPSGTEDSYIAVGFSKDSEMGQDSVNECTYVNGNMRVYTSYNSPEKDNERISNASIVTVLDARFEDGNLYCKFMRSSTFTYDGITFSLSEPHFLLLAKGLAGVDGIEYHSDKVATSSAVNIGPVEAVTSPPSTRPTTLPVTTSPSYSTTLASTPSIYQGCKQTKNCFGIPSRCVDSGTCSALVTYSLQNSEFVFELFGKPSGTNSYIAVGFSKDRKMGKDSVNECALYGNQVKIHTSHNYDQPQLYNKRIDANITTVLAARYENGNIYCRFIRQPVFTYENMTYNLSEPNYLMLVRGPTNADNVDVHDLKIVSSSLVNIGDIEEVTAEEEVLVKVHGALMICAWILSASVGILLARYFRQTWVGQQLGGKDLWFAFHRIIMVIVWMLTIISFIIIFVEVDGWTDTASYNPHAIIGCVTTGLAFIQPFMAYFRPHPGTPRRPIFNWVHWTVGNSAHILGIACIFLAVDLPQAGLPEWSRWILVAYVVFHVAIHLLLTIMQCHNNREGRRSSTVYAMKELNTNAIGNHVAQDAKKQDTPGSAFRKAILGVYIIVMFGFAAALIAAVVRAPW